jgi:zinc protease
MKRPWFVIVLLLGLLAGGCVPVQPLVMPAQPAVSTGLATEAAAPTAAAPAATVVPAATPTVVATAAAVAPTMTVAATTTGVTTATAQVWQLDEMLPLDPNIRAGKLANGLTYLIRHNPQPKNRAELRLVVNAGSTLEDADQQGLAHFLEHMLFKGTKRFPHQDLINFLESIGMQFGPDINAYTSFDETVYELRIPLDDPAVTDKALDVLVDWAGSATLAQADVDSERGVIVEEHRLRDLNAGGRISDQIYPLLLGNSRYAERLPIGDMNIVQTASADTIRRFYEKWYRPDLMAVIAVGDFDMDQMAAKIREKFAGLTNPKDEAPRPTYTVPDFQGTRYLTATDPENPDTGISIYFRQPVHESQTAGEYRGNLVNMLFYAMLNDRYLQISRQASPPFNAAQSGTTRLVRTAQVNIIGASTQETNIVPALTALLTEVQRVRQYGFTQPELDRAKADLTEGYRLAASGRDSTDSSVYVDEFIRHFLNGETVPGIGVEYQLVQQFMPGITLDEVNKEVSGLLSQGDRAVVVVAPQKAGFIPPTEAQLADAVKAAATAQVQPYAEQATATALMTTLPEPAKIISETAMPDLGVTDIRLANGVRVVMKPTDLDKEQVLFAGIGPGGASLVGDKDYLAATMIGGIVAQSGVAGFDRTQLDRLLAGKSVSVRPGIGELAQTISGGASPRDLETAFQLIYLYATQPRLDQTAVDSIKSSARAALANRQLDPNSTLNDTVTQLEYGDSIRRRAYPPLAEIENLDVQRAFQIYKERFANMGQFTFVFVGKFDVAQVKALAQRYLGTLPSTGKVDQWQDTLPGFLPGVREKDVYQGQDQSGVTEIIYNGPIDVTPKNELRLSVLRRVLDITLLAELRTKLSATYSPSVSENIEAIPKSEYSVSIDFTTDPALVNELVNATFATIDTLRTQGPTADDLAKAKEQEKRAHEDALAGNSYWLGLLENYAFDPQHSDPARAYKTAGLIDSLTVQDIQSAAQEYLRQDRYVRVTLYPKSAEPGGQQQALLSTYGAR